jgi:hypothetical protein
MLAICNYANGQDMAKQLQRQMWYVKGDIYKGDTCSIHIDKTQNCTGYLIFNKEELEMHLEATGNRFVCKYQIINDKMKLHYAVQFTESKKTEQVEIFYRLTELRNGKDLKLIPLSHTDFK